MRGSHLLSARTHCYNKNGVEPLRMKNFATVAFAFSLLLQSCHGFSNARTCNSVHCILSRRGYSSLPIGYIHPHPRGRSFLLDTGTQLCMAVRDDADNNTTQMTYHIRWREQRLPLQRLFISTVIALSVMFTSSLSREETPTIHDRHFHMSTCPFQAYAGDSPSTGMACVAEHCSSPLSRCLSDLTCAKGLGCFMNCAMNDALASEKNIYTKGIVTMRSEGACQVRCMDLYQNKLLDDFTECSLTKYRCYDALRADAR